MDGEVVMVRRVFSQGLSLGTMVHDGSFESRDLGLMTLEQFVALIRLLPIPVDCDSTRDVCPPTVGLASGGNVCRIEGHTGFVVWTDHDSGSQFVDENGAVEWAECAWRKAES